MPIYEFVCEACGRLVERLQKLSDPPPEACPECGGKMAKVMSRNSFQLKGGGWYRDLYSSSGGTSGGSNSGGSNSSGSTGSDAKPAAPSTGGEKAAPAAPSAPAAPASPAPKKAD